MIIEIAAWIFVGYVAIWILSRLQYWANVKLADYNDKKKMEGYAKRMVSAGYWVKKPDFTAKTTLDKK